MRCWKILPAVTFCIAVLLAVGADAQKPTTNYDESKVPAYTLPDPLVCCDGSKVADAAAWPKRRQEIVRLFEQHVYGKAPGRPEAMTFKVRSVAKDALGGKATRKEVSVLFAGHIDELGAFVPAQINL